jgi:ABC-2 type transport system ATP-binding protein
MTVVVDAQNLKKRYGETLAVDDLSFQVAKGEIFGILGPNGAGKTTAVESLIGLRRPDQGSIRVLGMDPQTQRRDLAQRIGVQLQSAALADRMAVWEALELFSSFYRRTIPWQPLLEKWGLADKRNALFANLSGGQKQRLFIALALVNDPEVVFLDELTTGLDPQARRATWELVRAMRDQGTTVVLVTHFMDEAEYLCDRVAIIDHGRVIALDRPDALIADLATEARLDFETEQILDLQAIQALPSVRSVVQDGRRVTVHGNPDNLAASVVTYLDTAHVRFQNLRTVQPNLEDVFIHRTGRQLRSQ